jgi:putative membrane protein
MPDVTPEVQAFATGFPLTLLHAAITVALLLVGAGLYALLTPYKDLQLIREGNTAASISLGGMFVGLALPLSVSLAASTGELEMLIWGVAIIAVQLLVFRITDMALRGLPKRIQAGEVAAATFLVAVKIATAIILAAAVAGVPIPVAA